MSGLRRTLLCWLLVGAGCDAVFGLESRAPADAAGTMTPTCPDLGAGPPVFGSTIEELVPRECFYFTFSTVTGQGYATCEGGIEEGPLGGPLQPSTIAPTLTGAALDRPAVSPEGDRLLIRQSLFPAQRMSWYARDGRSWTWRSDVVEASAFTTPGAPSAAPDRRAIIAFVDGYREYAETNDVWTELRSSPWSRLGVSQGAQPHLSPDALRLTFVDGSTVLYADRADRDSEFGLATKVTTIGSTVSAFITDDCARAYYSAGGAIVFRQQL